MQEDGEEVVEAGLVAERGPQGGWGGEVMGVVKGEADLAVERKVVEGVGWVAEMGECWVWGVGEEGLMEVGLV